MMIKKSQSQNQSQEKKTKDGNNGLVGSTPSSICTDKNLDTQITQEIEKQYEGLSKKEIKELERDAYFQLQKKFVYVEMLKAKLEGFQLGKSQALSSQKKKFMEIIDDVDIELFLTDIKDKEGNKAELSDELMEIIRLWWESKSEELKQKLREVGLVSEMIGNLIFGFIVCDNQEEVKSHIKSCEGKHIQQIAYSSYHDALTQICFGCKEVRTSLKKSEMEKI